MSESPLDQSSRRRVNALTTASKSTTKRPSASSSFLSGTALSTARVTPSAPPPADTLRHLSFVSAAPLDPYWAAVARDSHPHIGAPPSVSTDHRKLVDEPRDTRSGDLVGVFVQEAVCSDEDRALRRMKDRFLTAPEM